MKSWRRNVATVLALVVSAVIPAQDRVRSAPWPAEIVSRFSALPIQDQGRVKPISTYAAFYLLGVNERRTVETPSGERLTPAEFLLDALFFPEQARDYRCFLVTDSSLLDSIGLSDIRRKKRDRYTFRELSAGSEKLIALYEQYQPIESKDRSLIQQQTLDLFHGLTEFASLTHYLNFARAPVPIPAELRGLPDFAADVTAVPFSTALQRVPALLNAQQSLRHRPLPDNVKQEVADRVTEAIDGFLSSIYRRAEVSRQLVVFPPEHTAEAESAWFNPSEIALQAVQAGHIVSGHPQMLVAWEQMVAAGENLEAFAEPVAVLVDRAAELARARNEYGSIRAEVAYYRWDLVTKSLVFYVLSFFVAALSWLVPRSRWATRILGVTFATATGLAVAGVTWRSIIQGRPPVLTLYDTILFITAVGSVTCLVIEWLNRKRVALSVGAVLGLSCMFLAMRYEVTQGRDTMQRLVAVLDTNFWLATHVTTVTAGYAAGLLAGTLGAGHILMRLIGVRRGDRAFYQNLSRMTYGVICFTLALSVVGTILGGIWANYSWGRFWGWDPKENGALMICLWNIAILHARLGGYIRQIGIAVCAVFGMSIVVFSWWHVNMLGVGLHSYGATEGATAKWIAYGSIWSIAGLGGLVHLMDKARAAGAAAAQEAASAR